MLGGKRHVLEAGGYAYVAPAVTWSARNGGKQPARFHWIRKAYEPVDGIKVPESFVTSDSAVTPSPMPGTDGKWATSRFVDPADLRHDMHVTIVTFEPGAVIPFAETHVMEHGLYVLEGKAVYRLNQDWVEVEAGDVRGGATVHIRDVAHVRDGYQPQQNIVRQDGRRGVLLTVLKSGAASTLDVVQRVMDLLPSLRAQVPPGVSIQPMLRPLTRILYFITE